MIFYIYTLCFSIFYVINMVFIIIRLLHKILQEYVILFPILDIEIFFHIRNVAIILVYYYFPFVDL